MNKEDILKSALVWGYREKGSNTPIIKTLHGMKVDTQELKQLFERYRDVMKFGIAMVGTEKHLQGAIQTQDPSVSYLMGTLALEEFIDQFMAEYHIADIGDIVE